MARFREACQPGDHINVPGQASKTEAVMNWEGPYEFNRAKVGWVFNKLPGNYLLGHCVNGRFVPRYDGRSDTDLQQELRLQLNPKYTHFMYRYARSARDAFEEECRQYHHLSGASTLDNKIHPDRPNGYRYNCPVCAIPRPVLGSMPSDEVPRVRFE